jgi:hypothetical protein
MPVVGVCSNPLARSGQRWLLVVDLPPTVDGTGPTWIGAVHMERNGDQSGTTRHTRCRTDHGHANGNRTCIACVTCGNAHRYVLGVKGSQVQILSSRLAFPQVRVCVVKWS